MDQTSLEAQIRAAIAPPRPAQTNNQLSPAWVFGIFLFLGAAVLGAWQIKNPPLPQITWHQPQVQAPVQPPQPQPETKTIDSRVTTLEKVTGQIWNRSKWNTDRLTLLASVYNHNLVVIQQNLPRSELILLNSDWTIDRMPNRIHLDENDKAFIKPFIRK